MDKTPDKVEAIFAAALEISSPEARAAYLDKVCGGDAETRRMVEELLDADAKAGSFLNAPAAGLAATIDMPEIAERPGTVIGRYKLREQIGEGGFGVVFVADQREPMRRTVAIKIMKPGMDSRQFIARFEVERAAMALMDHPNIAHVYDAGATESGRPYFVMELIKGRPLTEYCDARRLTLRERLELFVPVCQAVQHAHQKGIVHRDLKPSNILVADYDEQPVPKVIDFGVAKSLGPCLTEKSLYTDFGRVLGTIDYMSPEQAKLNQLDIDTRSDIYSLGVVLYELIAGQLPFDRERLRTAAFEELFRIIREEEPPKPSMRLSASQSLPAIAEKRHIEPAKLSALVRRDLDWIVMKALEKERKRRYDTAKDLAADIERFLGNEPVEACAPSAAYRLRKFVRRNRVPVMAAAAVLMALVAGIFGTTYGLIVVRQERDVTVTEKKAKEEALKTAEAARDRAEQAEQEALVLSEQRRRQGYTSDMYAADRALEASDTTLVHRLMDRYLPDAGSNDLREFAWHYLWRENRVRYTSEETLVPVEHLRTAAVSPDEKRLAVASSRGVYFTVWDLSAGVKVDEVGKPNSTVWSETAVAFSGDSTTWAYFSENYLQVVLRDLKMPSTERLKLQLDKGETLSGSAMAFSPVDAILAVTIANGNKIRLWNAKSGERIADLLGHEAQPVTLAFSTDGHLLASGDAAGGIVIWDLASRQPRKKIQGHTARINALAFAPDSKRLASASSDRSVRLWNPESGQLQWNFPPFSDEVRGVSFSPDGELLAAGGRDHLIRVWNATTYASHGVIRSFAGMFFLSFLRDGRLAFASDQGVTVCKIQPPPSNQIVVAKNMQIRNVVLTNVRKDQLILGAISSPMDCVKIWRVGRNQLAELDSIKPGFVLACIAATPDGLLLLCEHAGPRAAIYDLSRMEVRQWLLPKTQSVASVCAFSKDGRRIAIGYADGGLALWDLGATGQFGVTWSKSAHAAEISCLAFDPSGKVLASGSRDQRLKVWNVADSSLNHDFGDQTAWVQSVAFSPGSDRLAAGFFSPDIKIWHWPSCELTSTFRAHFMTGSRIAFLQDRRTFVSAGTDRVVKIWDLETLRERCSLKGDASIFMSLAVSPDEKTIAAGARDGTVRVYRTATREEVESETMHTR